MKIRILKLGSAAHEANVQDGATIGETIEAAGISPAGYSLTLNGMGTGPDTVVSDGDVVTMVPKVEGGR